MACSVTGMANSRRNRESVKMEVSMGLADAFEAITMAAPDMAAYTTCPPGARNPRKKMVSIIYEKPPPSKQR